jgi:hypothetical protein
VTDTGFVTLAVTFHRSLKEFITTVTELIAMAAAATMGLKMPAIARGTAAAL